VTSTVGHYREDRTGTEFVRVVSVANGFAPLRSGGTMKAVLKITCVVWLVLCRHQFASAQPRANQSQPAASVKDKVRECVFKYQFRTFGLTDSDFNNRFFLCVGSRGIGDPSPALLEALKSRSYTVKPISQCNHGPVGAFDIATRKQGLIFTISDLAIGADKSATVTASFFKSGFSGNSALYTLKCSSGAWSVTKCVIKVIF
jgi:hypothetical protein